MIKASEQIRPGTDRKSHRDAFTSSMLQPGTGVDIETAGLHWPTVIVLLIWTESWAVITDQLFYHLNPAGCGLPETVRWLFPQKMRIRSTNQPKMKSSGPCRSWLAPIGDLSLMSGSSLRLTSDLVWSQHNFLCNTISQCWNDWLWNVEHYIITHSGIV